MKKTAEKVDPSQVPEVQEFLQAQAALEAFKKEYVDIFHELSALVERYNATLEAADKTCRTRQISSGPFDLYQFGTRYDAEQLFLAVSPEEFAQLGGRVVTKTVYEVERTWLETAIARGALPEEVVRAVRKEIPNFHKPEKVVL